MLNYFIEDNLDYYYEGSIDFIGTTHDLNGVVEQDMLLVDQSGNPLGQKQEKKIGFIWNE